MGLWRLRALLAVALLLIIAYTYSSDVTSSLFAASAAGDIDGVLAALEDGANVKVRDDSRGYTPLMYAAAAGSVDIIEVLIEQGAELESVSTDGLKTALMLAIYHSHIEVVKYLLRAGANIHAKNSRGDTPLSLAVYRADRPILALLLQRKPNLDIQTLQQGFTPLHIATLQCNGETIEALLSHGARATVSTKEGLSARQIAEKQCDSEILDLFDEYESFQETHDL